MGFGSFLKAAAPLIPGVGGAIAGAIGSASANRAGRAVAGAATPQFNPLLKPQISNLLDKTKDQTITPFQGDRVADLNNLQQQGIGQAQGLAGTLQGQQDTIGQGFNTFASGANVGSNPFLEQQIQGLQQSANQNLQRNVLPGLRNNAVASGGIGGSRQGIAEGLAASDNQQQLINAESSLRFNQLNNDLSQQLQALTNQGAILGNQDAAQQQLLNTGSLVQGQAQAEIGGAQALDQESQTLQFNRDKALLATLLGTGQATPPTAKVTNPLVGAIGGALAGQQLFGKQQQPLDPAAPQLSQFVPAIKPNAFTDSFGFGVG